MCSKFMCLFLALVKAKNALKVKPYFLRLSLFLLRLRRSTLRRPSKMNFEIHKCLEICLQSEPPRPCEKRNEHKAHILKLRLELSKSQFLQCFSQSGRGSKTCVFCWLCFSQGRGLCDAITSNIALENNLARLFYLKFENSLPA